MQKSGFTTEKSKKANAPIINELPFTMECEFVRATEEGNIIGKVVNISVDDSILDKNGMLTLICSSLLRLNRLTTLTVYSVKLWVRLLQTATS